MTAPSLAPDRPRARDLVDGVGCLVRGIGLFAATPGLWPIGLLPALLALAVLVVIVVGFVAALPAAVGTVTPFANGWNPADRDTLRLLIEVVLAAGAVWLAVISYTALALTIGQPFYEAISRRVDPAADAGRVRPWRAVGRALRDGLLLVVLTAALSLGLLVLGLVPLVGQTVVPVLGACVTGFFLSVELTSIALERRGLGLGARLALLWRRRLLALGFGLVAFVLFLIPLGAVLCMPGAVAGGTLLARRMTGAGR